MVGRFSQVEQRERWGPVLGRCWVGVSVSVPRVVRVSTRAIGKFFVVSAAAVVFAGVALSQHGSPWSFAPDPAELRKAPNSIEKQHPSPTVDGQTWGLRSYENVAGNVCLSHDVPGEAVGTNCVSRKKLFTRGPLAAYPGARQIAANYPKTEWDNMWVYGAAHPQVATLRLVNIDCSTQSLQLDGDGVFNHVVGAAQIREGLIPYKLIASDARGQVVAERTIAIGLTYHGKRAGLEAPTPGRACS